MSDRTLMKAKAKRAKLTLARLKELLRYDPLTGDFTWLIQRSWRVPVGSKAGVIDNGYVLIGIDGVKYQAHVLAWFYMTGTMPDFLLDHENNERADNRWNNLRRATRSQNNANVGVKKHNMLGIKGVQRHRTGRFAAKIQVNGKQKYLGLFDTPEEAGEAYRLEAIRVHEEFANA